MDHGQQSRSLHLRDKRHEQFPTPQKEKSTRKRREKRKQGARLVEARKSHITQIHNLISGKLQSPQRITKYFFTSQKKITISRAVFHIGQHPIKAKTTRKRKKGRKGKNRKKKRNRKKRKGKKRRKGRRKRKRKGGIGRKEGRTGIMEKAGLKSFPSEAYRPLRIRSSI